MNTTKCWNPRCRRPIRDSDRRSIEVPMSRDEPAHTDIDGGCRFCVRTDDEDARALGSSIGTREARSGEGGGVAPQPVAASLEYRRVHSAAHQVAVGPRRSSMGAGHATQRADEGLGVARCNSAKHRLSQVGSLRGRVRRRFSARGRARGRRW